MKTFNTFIEENSNKQVGPMKVKSPDEQRFIDKHKVEKHPDRNGNDDKHFKASNIAKDHTKAAPYHGDEDAEVYESADTVKKVPDGYHVVGGQKQEYKGHFKDSRKAIRHADKEEDKTGYVHHVHHVKDGVTQKTWSYSDSHGRYAPHNDFKGDQADHKIVSQYAKKAMGEEVEQNDQVPADMVDEQVEKLDEAISDLSNATRRAIFNVFEQLSEDNRFELLEMCESEDGIEKVISFAINYGTEE